ncbi:unnamed protein product (macronuclear) [Paramecium tetraurelia]|uniref:RRM domain-containing protein n=1 Tax=Paramecium tetraurelia TaxID=5888 RepID=A0BQ16_PARTE|nr:uncharacterized protein GSPATT00005384001 [Paramecium tetraurelia]CAK60633.1 unnamed protein product [Paramecium tetraurelia]|eukprot:XP_001428031.1 hypothetical protein (macronuclear) [Paramecium tetraurelia strain d4-2]
MFQLRNYIYKFSKLQNYTQQLRESFNRNQKNFAYASQIPQEWNEEKFQEFFDPQTQYIKKGKAQTLFLVHFVIDSLNRFNGRAFIEMESEDAVKEFMKKFQENKLEEQDAQTKISINPLVLKIYRKPLDQEKREKKKTFLTGLPRTIKNEELLELVKDFGEIENIEILKDKKGEFSRGQAIVVFKNEEDARKFKYFANGKQYMGKKIQIELRSLREENEEQINENEQQNQGERKDDQQKVDYSNLQKMLDTE